MPRCAFIPCCKKKSDTPAAFTDISLAHVAINCPEMPDSTSDENTESVPQHQALLEEGEPLPLNFDSLETFRDWKASADEDKKERAPEACVAGEGHSPELLSKPNQAKEQLQDGLDCTVSELAEERQLRKKVDCELPQLGGNAQQQLDKWPSMAQSEKTVCFNLYNSKPPSEASDVSHNTMDGAWLPVEKPGRKAIYENALPSDQPINLIKDKVPTSPRPEPEVTSTPEASELQTSFSTQMEADLLDCKTSDAPIVRKIVTRRTKAKTAPIVVDTPTPSEPGLGLFAEPPAALGLLLAEPPSNTGLSTKRLVKRRAPSAKPASRLSESSEDSLLDQAPSL